MDITFERVTVFFAINFTCCRILMPLDELCEFRTFSVSVYSKHRHSNRKFWRQRSACQHPTDFKGAKSQYSVNLQIAKAISKMYGVLVQVGSGRNK